MRPPSQRAIADRRGQFAFWAGAITAAMGGVALFGWIIDVRALRGPIPSQVDMKANTAIGLLCAGTSLCLLARGRHRPVASALAIVTALIGLLVVVEYAIGRSLGIDEALFDDDDSGSTVHPGRLAPQTAAAFLFLGVSLTGLAQRKLRAMFVEGLSLVVFIVCLSAVIGYSYGGEALAGVTAFTPIALLTAIALLCLSTGIAALGAGSRGLVGAITSAGLGGVVARRLFIGSVVLIPIIGWLRLRGETSGLYSTETGVALYGVSFIIVFAAGSVWAGHALDHAEAARHQVSVLTHELGAIVRSSREAIFGIDREGLITSWNAGAEALYDRPAEAVVGKSLASLLDAETDGDVIAACLDEYQVGLFYHQREDGSEIYVEMTFSPLLAAQGDLRGASILARDVTERRRLEQDQIAARTGAERANQAKSEFLSRMSHELRTPLNAILGFGQLLELEELEAEQHESVGYILKAGTHLLALIDEVLQVSRIEAGDMTISPEPVEVEQAIDDAIGMIAPLAAAREVTVVSEMDALAGIHVRADHQRFKQVLLNLLSNAVKYNRSGGSIIVTGEATEEHVRVHVTDTGSGISPDGLSLLFVPFERLGAEQGSEEGTGLGLSLSRHLTELMGGRLDVRTTLGEGSTFTVELPATSPVQAEPADDSLRHRTGGAPGHFSILYVEDNMSNLRLIERIFARRPEIELIPTMQGSLALDLARQHQPDLILLDLHLPDMPGEEVLVRLKREPATADIPVVILSADATPGRVARLSRSGAEAYLTKPLDVRELMRTVERFTERSGVVA